MRVFIALGNFPCVSETFILEHIVGLIENGCDVHIISFFGKNEDVVHKNVYKYDLIAKTRYIVIPKTRKDRLKLLFKILLKYWIKWPILLRSFTIDWRGLYWAVNNVFKLLPFLESGWKGSKDEIVHCHYGIYAKEYLFLKYAFSRIKLFVTFHGWDIRKGLAKGPGYYKELFELADKIIAISRWNRDRLLELGTPDDKIVLIPNGIDIDKFSCREEEKSNQTGIIKILTVARLVEVKNLPFAIKVMKRLIIDEGLNFIRYEIIGDGPLRGELRKLIEDMSLENYVILLGPRSSEYVASSMKSADIFFLPSTHEAFPTVLLEAGASCLPAVASNIAGVGEIIQDGKTGILFECNDMNSAIAGLKKLILDKKLRERMGKKAREVISSKFSRDAVGKKLCHLYKSII